MTEDKDLREGNSQDKCNQEADATEVAKRTREVTRRHSYNPVIATAVCSGSAFVAMMSTTLGQTPPYP